MKMYFMNVDEVSPSCAKVLTEECLNHINRYPNIKNKQESLAAYLLLTYAIKDNYKDAVIPLDLDWTEEGKPYLQTFKRMPHPPENSDVKNNFKEKKQQGCETPLDEEDIIKKDKKGNSKEKSQIECEEFSSVECSEVEVDVKQLKLFFSISHSDRFAVVCISDKAIGVDIEKVRAMNPSLSRKLIHKNNKESYENSDDKSKILLENWCLKEAYYKCSGKIKPASSTPLETYNMFKDIYVIDKHNYGLIKYFDEYCMALVTKDIVSIEKSASFMVDKSKIESLLKNDE